jgi:hypothetical protein
MLNLHRTPPAHMNDKTLNNSTLLPSKLHPVSEHLKIHTTHWHGQPANGFVCCCYYCYPFAFHPTTPIATSAQRPVPASHSLASNTTVRASAPARYYRSYVPSHPQTLPCARQIRSCTEMSIAVRLCACARVRQRCATALRAGESTAGVCGLRRE